jgi:hypothetical protein
MKSLPQFESLIQLKLTGIISAESALVFFNEIGTACPKIKLLKLGNNSDPFPFMPQHQLALVLGGREKMLSASILEKFNTGKHKRISFDSKTPICNSLEVVSIWSQTGYTWENPDCYKLIKSMSIATNVFMLRHFGNLMNLAVRFDNHLYSNGFINPLQEAIKELFDDPTFKPISRKDRKQFHLKLYVLFVF